MKTAVHQNSKTTYKTIHGNFSRMEKFVIDALLILGEATDERIANYLNMRVGSIQPRITEMYGRKDSPLIECGTEIKEYKYPDGVIRKVPARINRLKNFSENLF